MISSAGLLRLYEVCHINVLLLFTVILIYEFLETQFVNNDFITTLSRYIMVLGRATTQSKPSKLLFIELFCKVTYGLIGL